MVDNECMYLSPSRFYSLANAPIWYQVHHPMEGVQGFTRSHWTLLSVKYSCCIALVNNRDACRRKNDKKHHTCRPFCWPWWSAGTIPSAFPSGGGSGLQQKPLINASGPVLQAIVAFETTIFFFFKLFHCQPAFQQQVAVMSRPPNNNRAWHIKLAGRS